MEAQRLHCELTDLSHHLTIPDDLIKKGNEYMQEIFLILQQKSKYKLDRCRLSGGVGKKTSISLKFDYDCVIYVNTIDPPFTELLDEWCDILTLRLNKLGDDIRTTHFSLQFKVDGFNFDILPAPNYTGSNHNIQLQREIIWGKVSRGSNAHKREKLSHLYSSGLSELALKFLEKQSGFIHDLCRLAKFWNCTVLFEQYVSGRSSIIECLAVKAGQEEEQAAINDKLSMLRAFRRFLYYFKKYEQIGVVFFDFYERESVSTYKKPYLIDPSNPYNNYLANVSHHFLPTLSKCSQETLDRLEKCEKNGMSEFERLFDPQPDLRSLFTDHGNVNYTTTMISCCQNCNEKLPRLIERRGTFDSKALENMKELMSCVLKHLSTIFNAISEGNVEERVTKATERFIDRSFYEEDHQWTSTTQKHDDFDITFILPLNTTRKHAVYISMTK